MGPIGSFKTYGTLLAELKPKLVAALVQLEADARMARRADPAHPDKQVLAVHTAFDDFAKTFGVAPRDTARLRFMLLSHFSSTFSHEKTDAMRLLAELPEEFCVRGEWVSRRVVLVEHDTPPEASQEHGQADDGDSSTEQDLGELARPSLAAQTP